MRIFALTSLVSVIPAFVAYAHDHGQINSVGNALATNLQTRPAVIHVRSRNCSMCRRMAPTVQQVRDRYRGRVTFITFDVSDANSVREAQRVAGAANLTPFFSRVRRQTGLILAVDPRSGKVIQQFGRNATVDDFNRVLEVAIADFDQR